MNIQIEAILAGVTETLASRNATSTVNVKPHNSKDTASNTVAESLPPVSCEKSSTPKGTISCCVCFDKYDTVCFHFLLLKPIVDFMLSELYLWFLYPNRTILNSTLPSVDTSIAKGMYPFIHSIESELIYRINCFQMS